MDISLDLSIDTHIRGKPGNTQRLAGGEIQQFINEIGLGHFVGGGDILS